MGVGLEEERKNKNPPEAADSIPVLSKGMITTNGVDQRKTKCLREPINKII